MNVKQQNAQQQQEQKALENAKVIYLLFLGSIFIPPLSLIALVIAYVRRVDALQIDWIYSHYVYLIHTYWKGLALFFAVWGLFFILHFLAFAYLGMAYWMLMRCVNGLKFMTAGQAIPDIKTWKF